jgi:hypothetical protein
MPQPEHLGRNVVSERELFLLSAPRISDVLDVPNLESSDLNALNKDVVGEDEEGDDEPAI